LREKFWFTEKRERDFFGKSEIGRETFCKERRIFVQPAGKKKRKPTVMDFGGKTRPAFCRDEKRCPYPSPRKKGECLFRFLKRKKREGGCIAEAGRGVHVGNPVEEEKGGK